MDTAEPIREEEFHPAPPATEFRAQAPVVIGGYEDPVAEELEPEAEAQAPAPQAAVQAGVLATQDEITLEPATDAPKATAVTEVIERPPESIEAATTPAAVTPEQRAVSALPKNEWVERLRQEMAERGEQVQDKVRFHFVECEHTPDNAERIAEALEGCQTVVFERGGSTSDSRKELEGALTMQLYDPSQTRDPEWTRQANEHNLPLLQRIMPYIAATVAHLPESVERIKLMDIPLDHPDYETAYASLPTRKELADGLEYYAPNAQLRDSLLKEITQFADGARLREAIMARQLDDTAYEAAYFRHGTVGVVTGALHSGTRHQLQAQGFTCTTTPWVMDPDLTKRHLVLEAELISRRIQDPAAPIHPMEIDRALFEMIMRNHGFYGDDSAAVASVLPDDTITSALERMDEIKATEISPNVIWQATKTIMREVAKTGSQEDYNRYLAELEERRRRV